jgi:hypothetical protein
MSMRGLYGSAGEYGLSRRVSSQALRHGEAPGRVDDYAASVAPILKSCLYSMAAG